MQFNAIVHAPRLRPGARLNIAEADQVEGGAPGALGVGAEVRIRFGVCCPDRSTGTIVGSSPLPPSVMLALGSQTWILQKSEGNGVGVPGLLSESWYVADEGTHFPQGG